MVLFEQVLCLLVFSFKLRLELVLNGVALEVCI